ncbi:MAG: hypothetical protein IJ925_07630 [Muribaculaceae bacterium]|nr:hypothetical protein [Muribaculaceae bacterium]
MVQSFFNNILKGFTPSQEVDGTHISKYAEKICNIVATVAYYLGLGAGLLSIVGGVIVLLCGLFGGLSNDYQESIGFGFLFCLYLIGSGIGYFILMLVFSAFLRVITNISLSLKLLNEKRGIVQQPAGQPVQQPVQQLSQYSQQPSPQSSPKTTSCPECGSTITVGSRICPECGCPLNWN